VGLLAFSVLSALALALGWGFTAHPRVDLDRRLVTSSLAGLLALHTLLLALDLAGWRWTRIAILLPIAIFAGLLWWRRRSWRDRALPSPPLGPGDAIAAGGLAIFAAAAAARWNVHSDFVYHWGVKAKKFHLAGGLDLEFLTQPWNAGHLHPDYPNLVPVTGAATATVAGHFDLVAVLLWSVVFFLLALLAGRAILTAAGVSKWGRAAGIAVLGLTLTMFGVGYLQAGGADLPMTLAMLMGAALLLARPDESADRDLGIAAAFAAAVKLEGLVLAALLIAAHLLRRGRAAGWRPLELARSVLRTTWPTTIVVILWAVPVVRYDLYSAANSGAFDPSRLALVAHELWRALLTPNWHGLAFVLLLLPALAFDRRLRPIAAVCGTQLAFYVYVYLSAPVDPGHYIETSAARLFFHLVPAVLMALAIALDRASGPRDATVSRA